MAAHEPATKKRPPHWDKRVSAAYLRILGATQKETAKGVGRSLRTIQVWEADQETWQEARTEARDRWLNDVHDASRSTVLRSVREGNADIGFRILERLEDRLAPPKQRLEHTGKDGGPMEHEVHEARERIASRVAGIALRRRANGSAPVSNGNGAHRS
jgi:hypothetical protein